MSRLLFYILVVMALVSITQAFPRPFPFPSYGSVQPSYGNTGGYGMQTGGGYGMQTGGGYGMQSGGGYGMQSGGGYGMQQSGGYGYGMGK